MTTPSLIGITGITGTLGTELTNQLLTLKNVKIIGISRDEYKQALFPYKVDSRVELHIGDVRDIRSLAPLEKCNYIFHLASLKHVDLGEKFPREFCKTIIDGTQNVYDISEQGYSTKLITVSTDKAVYASSVYGAAKFISERITLQNPKNAVVRYGNVLNSRGSLIEIMYKKTKAGQPIGITDPGMTRFWVSIEAIAAYIIKAAFGQLKGCTGGGVYVPNMRAASLLRVVRVFTKVMGGGTKVILTGKRPGERMHEISSFEGEKSEKAIYSSHVTQISEKDLEVIIRREIQKYERKS